MFRGLSSVTRTRMPEKSFLFCGAFSWILCSFTGLNLDPETKRYFLRLPGCPVNTSTHHMYQTVTDGKPKTCSLLSCTRMLCLFKTSKDSLAVFFIYTNTMILYCKIQLGQTIFPFFSITVREISVSLPEYLTAFPSRFTRTWLMRMESP